MKVVRLLLLLVFSSLSARAGLLKIWQIEESARAQALVVGRVLKVEKLRRIPSHENARGTEIWELAAEVEVLRSFPNAEAVRSGRLLQVAFRSYGTSVTMFVNGDPPPLPQLTSGDVRVFPLFENPENPNTPWRLCGESGVNLTIPARADIVRSEPPATARAFLDNEIASALAFGSAGEVNAMAVYVVSQMADLSSELMPLLEAHIGKDRRRWANLIAALLASNGVPRPSVQELVSGNDIRAAWGGRGNLFLLQAALRKLGKSVETDEALIQAWIVEAPLHAWGSANSLLEYGDHPKTTDALRQALRANVVGSSYIAWTLAHNGHVDALEDAKIRALRVVDRPGVDATDLQGAAALLRDFGSSLEVRQLAALVSKYQKQNRDHYHLLWQFATDSGNAREAPVLAVVLQDRRVVFRDVRYCDLAVNVAERTAGRKFGANALTTAERDAAVSKAFAWALSNSH